ncbi:MAG: RDD family protein [Lapillicoccus sp.]
MNQRAGWYDDPENSDHLRYFDGVVWTSHTTPKAAPTAPVAVAPPTAPMPQTQDGPGYAGGPQTQYGQHPAPQHPAQQQGYPPSGPGGYASAPPVYGSALGVKTTPDGQPLASYGQRVGAYLLDALITGAITLLLGGYWLLQFFQWYAAYLSGLLSTIDAGGNPAVDQTEITSQATSYLLPVVAVGLVVQVVYQVAFLTRKGATPGKMAVGIAVRHRDRPGVPDLMTVLKRVALGVVSSLLGFLPAASAIGSLVSILDLLWPLWDDKRQALHDKIAGTNVVVQPRKR